MASRKWQIQVCERCRTYTKHTSNVTPETVTKTCLVCNKTMISNRAAYAAKVEKNKAGRKRHEVYIIAK